MPSAAASASRAWSEPRPVLSTRVFRCDPIIKLGYSNNVLARQFGFAFHAESDYHHISTEVE